MKTVIELLNADPRVSGWKINEHKKESYELFFVKGALETVRCTDTRDKQVTLYADHDGCKGDSQFFIYPSTTARQLEELISDAVSKALLISNQDYALPQAQAGEYTVESNFADHSPADLAETIAREVFAANTLENASLNSVEVFVNRHTETVRNSRGLHKTQVRYDAMVEAIPTYNGDRQSVELYEQYNFNNLDIPTLRAEIAGKMAEVKARYEAAPPESAPDCPVVLNPLELSQLFGSIARNLNYGTVYSHANLWKKGDAIQTDPRGDVITVTAAGQVSGSVNSAKFDEDGLSLGSICLVDKGRAVNYYGSNRFGQYLGEVPTGELRCLVVEPGSAVLPQRYLEVISMSGLQVDFFNDYIGGEIRLAYYHDGESVTPVTGISISGKAKDVLNNIRLSPDTCVQGRYFGPRQALVEGMKIF